MTLSSMGTQSKVLLGAALLAVLWTASRMALLPLGVIAGNGDILAGVAVLALIAYWAASEAEDGDGFGDVVDKTSDRAEEASRGFLEGMSALVIGAVAVALTVGSELLGLVFGLVDIAGAAPGVAGTIGAGLAGLAGMFGVLNTTTLVVVVVALVLLVVYSRME